MKFRWPLLFAAVLLLIHPNYAPAQQGKQETKKVQGPTLRRTGESIDSKLLERIRLAAEKGEVNAQFQLGMMYSLGDGVPQDYVEAEKWLLRAAEQEFPPAQYNLGMMYRSGDGVAQDDEAAEKWINSAAEQGYPPVQKESGETASSITPLGTPQEVERLKWIRSEAERGNPPAQVDLGLAYVEGTVIPQDYIEASKWFRRAAERGDVGGQFNLGLMYYRGEGVPQDFIEAAKWLGKAAEQDDIASQFNLGLMHLQGQGMPQNYREAVTWFRTPAEKGFASAQFNLGLLYFHGNGVPQDQSEAAKWFRKAAEQGDLSSQCMLGAIYCEENSADQDYVQAYKWLSLCAASDRGGKRETASKLLDGIFQKMTAQEIKKAEQQIIKFVETHAHRAGNNIYLSGGGVTAPVALERPTPPYTEQARKAGISGKVVVACIVRKTGDVDSCRIQKGLGHGLDESTINTLETKWRFQPGRILRKPVDIFARIQITFIPN